MLLIFVKLSFGTKIVKFDAVEVSIRRVTEKGDFRKITFPVTVGEITAKV